MGKRTIAGLKEEILFEKKLKEDPVKAIQESMMARDQSGNDPMKSLFYTHFFKTLESAVIQMMSDERVIQAVARMIVHKMPIPKDGKDGKTPVFGEDFFTPREQKEFAQKIRPKRGTDYFTEDDIQEVAAILREMIKPVAGIDYPMPKDGKDAEQLGGEDIVKEINKLSIEPDKQIDAKHIKNLPRSTREGTELFRGGLKLQWNTKLDGTVNGTNKVFTVPADLPDPKDDKFIISVRGVLKTSDAGDFTTSNNNRTITFVTAPPNNSDSPRIILYHGK